MTDLRLTTGERVRILRDRADLTLDGLAERSGAHRGTIHAIESGKARPRVETLQALAAALGTTVAALLGESEVRP